jgi:hypothetical protein
MDAAKGLRSFVQRYFETAGAGGNRGIKTSPLGEIERESVATMENWIKWKSSLVVQDHLCRRGLTDIRWTCC